MSRVIISAGHTTKNPGTILNGLREVEVARSIAKAIIPHLRQNGVLTLSVPYELELKEKIEWINKTGYKKEFKDICLEIHLNEADTKKSGIEGWFEAQGKNDSQSLTEKILESVDKETALKSQGAKSELSHELKSLAFVSQTAPIGSLLEVGYLDNKEDVEYLKNDSNIQKIGKAIAKGILKFLDIEYKEVTVEDKKTISPVAPPPKLTPPSSPVVSPPAQSNQLSNFSPMSQPPRPISPMGGSPFDMPSNFSSPPSSFGGGGGMGSGGGSNHIPTRDERKDMIVKQYVKILGREPNQSDLNYFLNTGISEDQLLKKMIESQEHADLVKARQEVLTTKAKFHGQQAELIQLRAETADKSALINNLNQLLSQKNIALTELHRKVQFYENQQVQSKNSPVNTVKPKYKEPLADRVFKYFSDRLG